jgi:hypothetical protein
LSVLLIFTAPVRAAKIAVFEDIMKPDMFAVSDERIIITERTSVSIYSLKDFHLIRKFGKEGEGPQEFKISPFGPPMAALPYNGKIYVSSDSKVSVFTNDGEFVSEARVMPFQFYRPFGDKFIFTAMGTDENKQTVLSINLADGKFNKLKELYLSDMTVGPSVKFNFPLTPFTFIPYKDRLYIVVGKEGFAIDVYDGNGTKLYRIKKDYESVTVPEDYKKKTLKWFQTNPGMKDYWEFFKDRITFKTDYPAIQNMFVTDDRVYVLTYKQKDGNSEMIVMDLKGKEEKRFFVPVVSPVGLDYYDKYDIYEGHLYRLVENVDDETWELHKTKLID